MSDDVQVHGLRVVVWCEHPQVSGVQEALQFLQPIAAAAAADAAQLLLLPSFWVGMLP